MCTILSESINNVSIFPIVQVMKTAIFQTCSFLLSKHLYFLSFHIVQTMLRGITPQIFFRGCFWPCNFLALLNIFLNLPYSPMDAKVSYEHDLRLPSKFTMHRSMIHRFTRFLTQVASAAHCPTPFSSNFLELDRFHEILVNQKMELLLGL